MKWIDRNSIWVVGLFAGGIVAVLGAPAYEMAVFVLTPVAGLVGAVSAQCAAYPPRGFVGAFLVTIAASGMLTSVSTVDAYYTITFVAVVVVAGIVSTGLGYLTSRWLFSRNDAAQQESHPT